MLHRSQVAQQTPFSVCPARVRVEGSGTRKLGTAKKLQHVVVVLVKNYIYYLIYLSVSAMTWKYNRVENMFSLHIVSSLLHSIFSLIFLFLFYEEKAVLDMYGMYC